MSYNPQNAPQEYSAQYLFDQLRQIQQELAAAKNELILTVLYAAPDRVYAGMTIYADGVSFNPTGAGEGIYRRNKANAAWVFVG